LENWRNSLNTGRVRLSSAGLYTTALAIGGEASPGNSGATELYNGTSWTELNDLTTARKGQGSSGTPTSALAFGGNSRSPGGDTRCYRRMERN
jgi:hypothetical protein